MAGLHPRDNSQPAHWICTVVDGSVCLPPAFSLKPSQSNNQFCPLQIAVNRGVGPPGAQVSLEQQAYMLLTEPERQTMAYYLQEYHEGHIGVQPLTMALFELFNTHAKVWQQQRAKKEVGDITFKKLCQIEPNALYDSAMI